LSKPKFAFEPHWSFKPKINVLAGKLATNYRYTLLMGLDNVSATFGVIPSVLEVKVIRHLKRKIMKFEHNLLRLQIEVSNRCNQIYIFIVYVFTLHVSGPY
jgi:hypothetical protein